MTVNNTAPLVFKFGGTSVEDAAAFQRLVHIVLQRTRCDAVVVVSAMSRVTDTLLAGVHAAAEGSVEAGVRRIEEELQRYRQVARQLLAKARAAVFEAEADASMAAIAELLKVLGAHPAIRRLIQDEIISHGERLSAALLAAVFQESAVEAVAVDARKCIITDEQHGEASPLWEECRAQTCALLQPLLQSGKMPILGGFIGAAQSGATTTLGRGGSDYTATLIGAALVAREIQIWTDVTGVLTADPRVVPQARTIARLSYTEAAELAYFGAKVLHPKTMQPAVELGIPVRICNSRDPEEPGTLVSSKTEISPKTVKAIAHKKGITVLQITSARMLGSYGFLRALFRIFDRHHTVVDVVTTSEVSVSLSIDQTGTLAALLAELEQLGSVEIESGRAIVCVVGEGLRSAPGVAAQVFNAIGDVNLSLISQGASKINLTFIIEQDRVEEVVTRLHAAFFEARKGFVQ